MAFLPDPNDNRKVQQTPPPEPAKAEAPETFLQRQSRIYAPQQSGASPVSSTGRMTAAPATSPAPTAPPAPTAGPAPALAPSYAPPVYTPGRQVGSQYTAGSIAVPQGGYATYNPTQAIPQATPYAQAPQNAYQAQQVQQFQAPQQQGIDAQQQQILQRIMANPESMSAQNVAQMKMAQQEQALAAQKQMMNQLGGNAASRGIDPGSPGYAQMMQRQAMQDTSSQMLGANRAIDLQKMQQDRADQLSALGASNDYLNASLGRAVSGFQTGLQGTEAQRAEQLAGIGSGRELSQLNNQAQQQGFSDAMQQATLGSQNEFNQYQSQFNAQNAAQQNALANEGLLQQGAQVGLGNRNADISGQQVANQNAQFGQSLAFDREKFDYGRQQDVAQAAASASAANAAQQRWADEQAMQYQYQQQQQQQALIDSILNSGGGGYGGDYGY